MGTGTAGSGLAPDAIAEGQPLVPTRMLAMAPGIASLVILGHLHLQGRLS